MILKFQQKIKQHFADFIKKKYDISLEEIVTEYPPDISMGDLAFPISFQIAKTLKRPPRKIAEEIVARIGHIEGCQKLEVAGGGYINLFFDREIYLTNLLASLKKYKKKRKSGKKIIIEHTNINPNKAAHIGHLRNACLGDTLGHLLAYKGENVEIQNYIDDTGVQVADVVFGFINHRGMDLEKIKAIKEKFDYYCWDLYTKVTDYFEQHPEHVEKREEILGKIERGENPEAELANFIAHKIVYAHLATMERINVRYNLLAWEGDILRLKFWEKAFEMLKKRKAIFLAQEGKNKGCWVMSLKDSLEFQDLEEPDKVIVRSNGTVTYVGKDIAYQLWKFGLLGRDFYYKTFHKYSKNEILWTSSSSKENIDSIPHFGSGSRVYNVIDVRQSYLQKIVTQGLRSLDYNKEADKSIHFSYEMVALTPTCCKEMGFELAPEDENRSYIEISGRKGMGIKADDLIDKLIEKSKEEIAKRNPEMDSSEMNELAAKIAVGALRYFMIKYGRNKVIPFDFKEAINFEGETGPYLQYTVVRANNIFNKLFERDGLKKEETTSLLHDLDFSLLYESSEAEDYWELISYISRMPEVIDQAIDSLELSLLAKYCFNLAQKFNSFYHKYQILREKNKKVKDLRIVLVYLLSEQLKQGVELMGIKVPHRM